MQKNSNLITHSSPTKSIQSPLTRSKKSVSYTKRSSPGELNCLSEYNICLSPSRLGNKVTMQSLVEQLEGIVENVYQEDPLKIKQLVSDFIANHLPQIRAKVVERLNLTQYLSQSLRYKHFGEIDLEMQREWRKNMLFMSLSTIWSTRMNTFKFSGIEQLLAEYHKYCEVVANLTYFYFREALSLLADKKINVFGLIMQQTTHYIINSLHDWQDIYHYKIVTLFKYRNLHTRNEMNMDYQLRQLAINKRYIDLSNEIQRFEEFKKKRMQNPKHIQSLEQQYCQIELVRTMKAIKKFSEEHTIAKKIEDLKNIRSVFLEEIQQSQQQQMQKMGTNKFQPLEKDDILGCMIFCIVRGQLHNVQVSLQAMTEMLGHHSQLLSRKGVDSFRADLESAVQYLVQQNYPSLITIPKAMQTTLAE